MGTDPSDPATLFVKPAGETAVAEAPKPKVMSDGLFVKKHMPRLVRAPSGSRARARHGNTRQPPKVADIQKELAGLVKEFGGYTLCRENKDKLFCDGPYLSVKTDRIVLKDDDVEHDMGEFEIFLNLEVAKGSRDAHHHLIRAFALQPNRADKSEDITHPHVQDNDICFGAGERAVDRALADCRFVDAFSIVNQILHTYNRESPYAELETWHDYDDGDGSEVDDDDDDSGGPCVDCDDHTEGACEGCFDHLCDGCAAGCTDPRCGGTHYYCPSCADLQNRFVPCADCHHVRPRGRRLCETRRYYVPGTTPARYRCDHCNARAITDGRPHSNTPGSHDVDTNAPDSGYTPVPPPRPGQGAPPADPAGRSPDAHLGFGAPGDDPGDAAGLIEVGDLDLSELGDDHTTRGWGAPAG